MNALKDKEFQDRRNKNVRERMDEDRVKELQMKKKMEEDEQKQRKWEQDEKRKEKQMLMEQLMEVKVAEVEYKEMIRRKVFFPLFY